MHLGERALLSKAPGDVQLGFRFAFYFSLVGDLPAVGGIGLEPLGREQGFEVRLVRQRTNDRN